MKRFISGALAAALCALSALPVEAHHAMGGVRPSSLVEGLVSGLAHPVIGLDHLAFIVCAGLIAGVLGLGILLPVVFVAASIAGVLLHAEALDLPAVELVVGASVIAIGLVLAAARAVLGRIAWALAFAAIGLFHGHAYGEAIIGAEAAPLWAYLAGLALVQSAIAIGAALVAARLAWTPTMLAPRLAGAAAFGIGLAALMAQILPG